MNNLKKKILEDYYNRQNTVKLNSKKAIQEMIKEKAENKDNFLQTKLDAYEDFHYDIKRVERRLSEGDKRISKKADAKDNAKMISCMIAGFAGGVILSNLTNDGTWADKVVNGFVGGIAGGSGSFLAYYKCKNDLKGLGNQFLTYCNNKKIKSTDEKLEIINDILEVRQAKENSENLESEIETDCSSEMGE